MFTLKKGQAILYENLIGGKLMSKHIVAITACAAGIAHTYMAQEAIEKECRNRTWLRNLWSRQGKNAGILYV